MEPIELQEFIESTLKQVEAAADVRYIEGGIEFEVSVVATKKAGGQIKTYVVNGEGEIASERSQRIKFKILALRKKLPKQPTQEIQRAY